MPETTKGGQAVTRTAARRRDRRRRAGKPQQRSILEDDTHNPGAHMGGGNPQQCRPGWMDRTDRQPAARRGRGGKARGPQSARTRQRHLVPSSPPCLADKQPGFPPAVLPAKADGTRHSRFLDHGPSPAGCSHPVQNFRPPLPAPAHLGASQEATSFCRGQR